MKRKKPIFWKSREFWAGVTKPEDISEVTLEKKL
jgi:hypothetical protein